MIKKIVLVLLILVTAFYLMGYTGGDVKNLYSMYEKHKPFDESNTAKIQTIAPSFDRAIIVSNSSTAYMVYQSGTYYVIRSETTYIITKNTALIIYTHGLEPTTGTTKLPEDFSKMNIVDELLTHYHNSPTATNFTYTGKHFFIKKCPTNVSYTITNGMTLFYLDKTVTITLEK